MRRMPYVHKLDNGVRKQMHAYLWEKKYGKIPDGYIFHHIDGDIRNNKIENLQLVTPQEHQRIHAGWIKGKNGDWVARYCHRCWKIKPLSQFRKHRNKKGEYESFGYCVECSKKICKKWYEENKGTEEYKAKRKIIDRRYRARKKLEAQKDSFPSNP